MSSEHSSDERSSDESGFDREEVIATSLDNQSESLRELVQSAAERTRAGEELTAVQVNAVRTELDELQALIETHLGGRCAETRPWEYAGEHVPRERLEERLDELAEAF